MTGPTPAEPVAGPYSGRRVALLTQHGKERVIAPVLEDAAWQLWMTEITQEQIPEILVQMDDLAQELSERQP